MSKGSRNEHRKQATIQFVTFMGDRWAVANKKQTRDGVLYDLTGALDTAWYGTRLKGVPLGFINAHRTEPPDEKELWQYLVS